MIYNYHLFSFNKIRGGIKKTDLLLSIVVFVGPLHSWVKDGLWCPHFDLQQTHVDPEHSRMGQLVGATLDFALDVLLQAGDAGLHEAIGEQIVRKEVSEDSLDFLGSYQRVRVLHQALTALHVALLQAGGQQVGHALKLATKDCTLEPKVCAPEEVWGRLVNH